MGHIVDDTDGELFLFTVFVNSDDLSGSGVLGAQTVSAGKDGGIIKFAVFEGSHNVQIQRFTHSTGLFGSVEDGDLFDGLRNGANQVSSRERSVQSDFYKTVFAALSVQVVNGFFDGIADRTHGDDDMLGVGSTVVVEELSLIHI